MNTIPSNPPTHDFAHIFPLMEGQDFKDLVADIRSNGLREPIVLYEGQVLDGRNRLRACIDAGIEPQYRTYEGADPIGYVVSLNLRRRHLNESQRSAVAVKIANMQSGYRSDLRPPANLPEVPPRPISQTEAADMLNVSERSVRNAKVVVDQGIPELVAKVEQGEVAVSAAAYVATLPEREQHEVVAGGAAEIIKLATRRRAEKSKEKKQQSAQQIADAADERIEPGEALMITIPPQLAQRLRLVAEARRRSVEEFILNHLTHAVETAESVDRITQPDAAE